MRVRKVSARSLPDNDGFQRRNNKQALVMRAECHHHVRRRILADASAGPLRVLPRQIEHSFHVSLASRRRLVVQPERDAIRRTYLPTSKRFTQNVRPENLAAMVTS